MFLHHFYDNNSKSRVNLLSNWFSKLSRTIYVQYFVRSSNRVFFTYHKRGRSKMLFPQISIIVYIFATPLQKKAMKTRVFRIITLTLFVCLYQLTNLNDNFLIECQQFNLDQNLLILLKPSSHLHPTYFHQFNLI